MHGGLTSSLVDTMGSLALSSKGMWMTGVSCRLVAREWRTADLARLPRSAPISTSRTSINGMDVFQTTESRLHRFVRAAMVGDEIKLRSEVVGQGESLAPL